VVLDGGVKVEDGLDLADEIAARLLIPVHEHELLDALVRAMGRGDEEPIAARARTSSGGGLADGKRPLRFLVASASIKRFLADPHKCTVESFTGWFIGCQARFPSLGWCSAAHRWLVCRAHCHVGSISANKGGQLIAFTRF